MTLDQREFEDFLQEHRGIVFRIANTYCPEGEERDDLVQEICLQLWRSYASYDVRRRFSTWMYRVALNTAISFARGARARQRRIVPLDDSGAGARADVLGLSETNVGTKIQPPQTDDASRDRRRHGERTWMTT